MPIFDDEARCKDDDSGSETTRTNEYDSDDSFLASENSIEMMSEHSVEVEVKRKRGRPSLLGRPSVKKRIVDMAEKPVGHLSYPANDFSLTVTKKGEM